MIAILIFSMVAAALVGWAGRTDAARDPRLTAVVLVLMAVFPVLWMLMPKFGMLPALETGVSEGGSGWVGGFLIIGWVLAGAVSLGRLMRAAAELASWHRRSVRVGDVGRIEVRMVAGLAGPVAVGVFRKVIFVPDAWWDWSDETRESVLAHERAHHDRRDPLWRWVAAVACAMNPFNPLVAWVARRLALQAEHACDAAVLGQGIAPERYARLLCDLAIAEGSPRALAPAMASESTLERRVRRIVARRSGGGGRRIFALIGLALVLAVACAAVGRKAPVAGQAPSGEVRLRLSAQAFPGGDAEGGSGGFAVKP